MILLYSCFLTFIFCLLFLFEVLLKDRKSKMSKYEIFLFFITVILFLITLFMIFDDQDKKEKAFYKKYEFLFIRNYNYTTPFDVSDDIIFHDDVEIISKKQKYDFIRSIHGDMKVYDGCIYVVRHKGKIYNIFISCTGWVTVKCSQCK